MTSLNVRPGLIRRIGSPYFCIFLILLVQLLLPGAGQAGRHCGAEGDWRSGLIPDEWPPPKARGRIPVIGGALRTVSFSQACKNHDTCYEIKGMKRRKCDNRFLADMRSQCDKTYTGILEAPLLEACLGAAKGYHEAVVRYGQPAYANAQANARNKKTPVNPPSAGTAAAKKPKSTGAITPSAKPDFIKAASSAKELKCKKLTVVPGLLGMAVSGGKLYILDDSNAVKASKFNKISWQYMGQAPKGGVFGADGGRLYTWNLERETIMVSAAGKLSWKPVCSTERPEILAASAGRLFVWRSAGKSISRYNGKSRSWESFSALNNIDGLAGSYGRLFALQSTSGVLMVSGAGKANWRVLGRIPSGRFLAALPNQALTWEPESGVIWLCRTK